MRGGGEAELGFGLHPDARGDGLMRRALGLLLDWGFEQGVAVVQWRAFVGNWASRRTVWELGFSFGPTVPRLLPHRGERRDAWTAWIGKDDPREPVEPWLVPPVLEADGVRLRPWRESDGAGLVEAAHDPVLREWIPDSPLPRTLDDVPGYLQRVHLGAATNGRVAWCVADAGDRRGARQRGAVRVRGRGRRPDRAGRLLVAPGRAGPRGDDHRAADGRPTGRPPARPTAGFGARRLYLLTAARNADSRRLAERVGFEHVGTERGSAPVAGGGFEDNALYDLLREDAPQAGPVT